MGPLSHARQDDRHGRIEVATIQGPQLRAELNDSFEFVSIVSAAAELFADCAMVRSAYGHFFYDARGRGVVMHDGWGNIDAAASTQLRDEQMAAVCRR